MANIPLEIYKKNTLEYCNLIQYLKTIKVYKIPNYHWSIDKHTEILSFLLFPISMWPTRTPDQSTRHRRDIDIMLALSFKYGSMLAGAKLLERLAIYEELIEPHRQFIISMRQKIRDEALKETEKMVSAGLCLISLSYTNQFGETSQDIEKALEKFSLASEKDTDGLAELFQAIYSETDNIQRKRLLEISIKKGCGPACVEYLIFEENNKKELLIKADKNGDPQGLFILGLISIRNNDLDSAFQYFKSAGEQGLLEAFFSGYRNLDKEKADKLLETDFARNDELLNRKLPRKISVKNHIELIFKLLSNTEPI